MESRAKQYAGVSHLSSTDTDSLPAPRIAHALKLRLAISSNDVVRSPHLSAIHAETQ